MASLGLNTQPADGSLCKHCFNLDFDKIQAEYMRTRHSGVGLQKYKESSEACATCSILFRTTQHFYPEVAEAASLYEVFLSLVQGESNQSPHDVPVLSLTPAGSNDRKNNPVEKVVVDAWKNRIIHFSSAPGKPCPWPAIPPGMTPSSNADDLAAQVKAWISQCEKNHQKCRNLSQGLLPRRTVQILRGSEPGNCKVRLYESSPTQRAPYVCLSHCWGKHQIIVTNEKNYEQHQNEIPWDSLSITFQEAIDFSCRLGIEFIWIDSLCIIQDSKPDWEQEAMMMASYYSNAELTIAATAAKDGSVGLFPRKSKDDQALELCGHDAQGRPYHLAAIIRIDHPFDKGVDETEHFPLMQRGWVYQEHILSRRFLHCGPRELVWECHSGTLCECGTVSRAPRPHHATNEVLNVAAYRLGTGGVGRRRRLWYETIENIMGLGFTYATDRFAATAGVATVLAAGYSGRYLAGLWEDSLVADLCWCVFEGTRPAALRRVPSWSWGSVSGELLALWCQMDISDPGVRPAVRVASIDCQPDPPSLAGTLTRGALVLEGRFAAGVLECGPGGDAASLTLGEGRERESFRGGFSFLPDDRELCGKSGAVEMHLLKMVQRSAADAGHQSAIYLALQPHTTKTGSYQRVGILRSHVSRGPSEPTAGGGALLDRFDAHAKTFGAQIE